MTNTKKKTFDSKLKHYIVSYSVCIFFTIIFFVPILVAILGGLKTTGQLITDPFGLPSPVEWKNYQEILFNTAKNFWLFMGNSLIVMAGTVILDVGLSVMAGYALSWLAFKGKKLIFNYFLLGLLFPASVAMLPIYLQLKSMHLINTHLSVILVQAAFGLPWHIMLIRGFFLTIPKDLSDACSIDGCGPIRFLLYMVIPLSTPVIATASVLAMAASWNNYFLPLLVLDSQKLYTLPLGTMQFMGQYEASWNLVMAFITWALIPAVLFYIFAQKYIVAGLTGGSIKG